MNILNKNNLMYNQDKVRVEMSASIPILLVGDSDDSRAAIELILKKYNYVEYRIDKFAGT
jgi:hypothetical protein